MFLLYSISNVKKKYSKKACRGLEINFTKNGRIPANHRLAGMSHPCETERIIQKTNPIGIKSHTDGIVLKLIHFWDSLIVSISLKHRIQNLIGRNPHNQFVVPVPVKNFSNLISAVFSADQAFFHI